ncbi:MAG TPA: hypothetical protein PKE30_13140, partial [Niabella sp.]|nr:hypothetical protein [Niabella sp.]
MHQFSNDERKVIVKALFEQRKNFDGTDEQFAQSFGINYSVYSRLKSVSDYSSLLSAAKWADVAYELQVDFKKSKWIVGKTDVYAMIEEEVLFCKKYAKSRICVESSDIGKTTAAKHLAATYKNIFYIDVSQCPGKIEFIRTLAKKLG